MDRLHRIRLLLGDGAIEKLQNSTVMVVGCGAVGSFAIEALARSGVGHIIVVDSDAIEETNINRQLFALSSTVGMPKVDVARARILDINPDADVTTLNLFFDENSELNVKPDFVIDAIDTVNSKIALYKWSNARGIKFISSMGAAMKTDLSKIRIGRISKTTVCPLASKVRHACRELNLPDFDVVFSDEVPKTNPESAQRTFGSMITVTGTFGMYLADYTIKNLIK